MRSTPEARRAYQREYRARPGNAEKINARQIAWRAANPGRVAEYLREARRAKPLAFREMHLRKKYGLTIVEWDAMLEQQGGRCACCGTDNPGAKRGWQTDHDHSTGRVRGILCARCNRTLGKLGDTAEGVRTSCAQFLRYLEAP